VACGWLVATQFMGFTPATSRCSDGVDPQLNLRLIHTSTAAVRPRRCSLHLAISPFHSSAERRGDTLVPYCDSRHKMYWCKLVRASDAFGEFAQATACWASIVVVVTPTARIWVSPLEILWDRDIRDNINILKTCGWLILHASFCKFSKLSNSTISWTSTP